MDDLAEVARLLDILGNRNRRRIIELLRQKPCFVTEISETLMISPKAVIDHLQLMEREDILSCQMDDRRRKYYYLSNDILVDVSVRSMHDPPLVPEPENGENAERAEQDAADERTRQAVGMLARMVRAHDHLVANLDQLNHDIETKLADLARNHNDLFKGERELTIALALSHESLTFAELMEVTECPEDELEPIIDRFVDRGLVAKKKNRIMIRGVHAE
ncbi:MAG: ArsR family transcriptional regulator [Methanoregula sp.]|jgi:ArsR family transcriptional regulator